MEQITAYDFCCWRAEIDILILLILGLCYFSVLWMLICHHHHIAVLLKAISHNSLDIVSSHSGVWSELFAAEYISFGVSS